MRRFDTRQQKPVSDWKVAREGGVGCVAPGAEQSVRFHYFPISSQRWLCFFMHPS